MNALNYLRPLICPAIAPAEAILTVKPWHCRMIKQIWIKGRFYCVGVVVAWFNCTLMSVLQGDLNLKVTTWSVGSVKTRFCFTTSSFFVSLWSKMIAQCNPRRLTAFRLVPYKLYLHTWRVKWSQLLSHFRYGPHEWMISCFVLCCWSLLLWGKQKSMWWVGELSVSAWNTELWVACEPRT